MTFIAIKFNKPNFFDPFYYKILYDGRVKLLKSIVRQKELEKLL